MQQRLDYETDRQFIIPIVAMDSSNLPKRSHAVVNVTIADENDNFPVITVTTVTNRAQVNTHMIIQAGKQHQIVDKNSIIRIVYNKVYKAFILTTDRTPCERTIDMRSIHVSFCNYNFLQVNSKYWCCLFGSHRHQHYQRVGDY